MGRLTTASLMAGVGLIAAGLAAIRFPTPVTAAVTSGLMLLALFTAAVGAVVRPAPAGAWRGFAVFGWGYFVMAYLFPASMMSPRNSFLPTSRLVQSVVRALHPEVIRPEPPTLSRAGEPLGMNGTLVWPGTMKDPSPVPLSEAEVKAWEGYRAADEAYDVRATGLSELAAWADEMAHAYITLLFALLGAVVGHALAGRDARGRGPSQIIPSTSSTQGLDS